MEDKIITKQLLTTIGIDTNDEAGESLLAELNQQLEQRIGIEVAGQLDDAGLKKMVELTESGDSTALQEFLKENVKDLEQIVKDQIMILLDEMSQNKDKAPEAK